MGDRYTFLQNCVVVQNCNVGLVTLIVLGLETPVKDVLVLNERVFWICDVWPLNNSYKKFAIFMFYLSVYIIVTDMDLYDVIGNLDLMVENILENILGTTTYLMLFLFRFSKMIKNVVAMVKRELAEDDFRDNEERQLYLSYNIISDNFGRYAVRTTAVIEVMWYSTPMLNLLKVDSENGTSSKMYQLPFRIHSFLDYEDNFKYYMLMYACEFPLMCIGIFHITSISLLLNLVLHVCGKFSILSYRIQNIVEDSENGFHPKIKELVERHVELITTANNLNSALQSILALELLQTSIRLAVLMYTILLLPVLYLHYAFLNINIQRTERVVYQLATAMGDDFVAIFTLGLYVMIVTLMLYLYSFIGEQLQHESAKVNDAYYDTDWIKLSSRDQKLLLYCMSNGRRTLNLTAGKFYTFSLFGFISIMKTCFGFVSVLRVVI